MNLAAGPLRLWNRLRDRLGERKFYPLLLGLLTAGGFLPLLCPGIPAGHDSGFHLTRILTLAEGLRHGVFPAWINVHALENFGYAPGLFYSDLFIYPAAALAALGVPLIAAYKIMLFTLGLLIAFSFYLAVLRLGRSYFGAFAAALLGSWSSYLAIDFFTRAALGEITAFLFLPWCILGIHQVIFEEKRGVLPLAFGFAGLFYTHNITFVLMTIITGIIFLCNLGRFLTVPGRILRVAAAALLALLLAAAASVPLLEQLAALSFNLTAKATASPIAERAVPFIRLFLELPCTKLADWLPPGLGLIFFIVLAQRLRLTSRRTNLERSRDILLLAGCFSLLAATSFLPWEGIMRLLSSIQFPWRTYLPATAFLAIGGGLLLASLTRPDEADRRRFWCFVLIIGCGFAWNFNTFYAYAAKIHEKNFFYSLTIAEAQRFATSGLHYLPAGRQKEDYFGRGDRVVFSRQPDGYLLSRPDYGRLKLEIVGSQPDTVIELPLNPYRGYRVRREPAGSPAPLPDFSRGKFELHLPDAAPAITLNVHYEATWAHRAAMAVSLFTLLAVLAAAAFRRKKADRILK